ncbi:MAG: DUF996 domain-containing protein, partial [Sulfurimonas sp.]
VLGENGERYSFTNSQWKSDKAPKVGQKVDFVVEDETATNIYVLSSVSVLDSLDINKSDTRKGAVFAAAGSGLSLLSIIPILGILLALAGIVLEILGVKKLSDNAQNQKDIFKNYLLGIALFIVGIIIATFVMSAGIIGGAVAVAGESSSGAGASILGMVFGVLLYLGFAIASIVNMYKALNAIGLEYDVPLMNLAAKTFVLGTLTIPLFGLGYLVLLVFMILKIAAYLKIEQ